MATKASSPKSTTVSDAWEVVDSAGRRHAKGTYEQAAGKFNELAHDNLQTARYGGLTLRRIPSNRR